MIKKSVWPIFFLITIVIFAWLFFAPSLDNGGDMVEYFGMTESIINHSSIDLTDHDYTSLKKYLAPGYFRFEQEFEEIKGGFMAYVKGKDGNTYALHFWAYSILATPVRLLLKFLQMDELNALRLTNFVLWTACTAYIMKRYLKNQPKKQLLLIVTLYLSPLIFFITYPGVDIWYPMLLLVAVFAFFHQEFLKAALVAAIASWHSQPIILLSAAATGYYLYYHNRPLLQKNQLRLNIYSLLLAVLVGFIALIPYVANLYMFGVLSPWNSIADGWTTIYGFGLHNASLKRLFEQFFDLDMGLFLYAPALLITGTYYMWRYLKSHKYFFLFPLLLIITALSYQTNPAWHYGTAGFAPTRHILFIIPFLVYFTVTHLRLNLKTVLLIALPLLMQIYALTFNNYLSPDFYNSVFHNPYARYVLNNYPQLYNPTPKIFVDTTTHADKKFIETAIYKNNGTCTKAYVTMTDKEVLRMECGNIPSPYESLLDDEFRRKANFPRQLFTIEATFWADPESCAVGYKSPPSRPFICMKTVEDVMLNTGIQQKERIRPMEGYAGAWKLKRGNVIKITVPPGYILDHHSLEGLYVNY